MGRPLIVEVLEKPITSCVICICTLVWAYIQKKNVGYSDVGFSYKSVVIEGQYWRALTSTISHISVVHLAFNMSGLWSLGLVEKMNLNDGWKKLSNETAGALPPGGFGTSHYLTYTLLLIVLSNLFVLAFYHVLIVRFRLEYYERVFGVGYSGVLFGWMTILSIKQPTFNLQLFGMFTLPISLAPFESLFLTSLIVPQASFFGHLSGILAGYVLAWDLFIDINLYWTWVLVCWLLFGFVASVKRNSTCRLPFLEIESLADSDFSALQMERSNDSNALIPQQRTSNNASNRQQTSMSPDERV